MEIASPYCSNVDFRSHCQSVVRDVLEVQGLREDHHTLRGVRSRKVDGDCCHKQRVMEMLQMAKSGDWVAACRCACEVAKSQSSCKNSLHAAVVGKASVAFLSEETWMAYVLLKTAMNVEILYLSRCLHQILCAVAAAAVAVALYDLKDEQPVLQRLQQQLPQQYQYDGFDAG